MSSNFSTVLNIVNRKKKHSKHNNHPFNRQVQHERNGPGRTEVARFGGHRGGFRRPRVGIVR